MGLSFSSPIDESTPESNDDLYQGLPLKKMRHVSVKFDKQNFVGDGGFAEVYEGSYRSQKVAVKKMKDLDQLDEAIKSFIAEAKLLSELNHKNILKFLFLIPKPNLSIVTEFCSNGDLCHYLRHHNPTWTEKVRLALDTAKGVAYLHRGDPPIIHRDLKARNLFLTDDLTVKIGDVGECVVGETSPETKQRGTTAYLPPEVLNQTAGYENAPTRDVYAFAIIMWEILTQEEPYKNSIPMSIQHRVCAEGFRPSLENITIENDQQQQYVDLMKQCWDQNPDERPNFSNIVEELTKLDELSSSSS
eukprot:gb/GECH01013913.1/.p1 GENE.gb/GECH01013913.1/~~gb/GECH01013913.1/.p1  ORF type:complete len:303 (+),score=69.05 gb/GECH01013913.1/:1-909(+)